MRNLLCLAMVVSCSGAQKAAEKRCAAADVAAVTAVLENASLTTSAKLAALGVIGAETVACVVTQSTPAGSGSGQ